MFPMFSWYKCAKSPYLQSTRSFLRLLHVNNKMPSSRKQWECLLGAEDPVVSQVHATKAFPTDVIRCGVPVDI